MIALTKADLVDADTLGSGARSKWRSWWPVRSWKARPSCLSARSPAPGSDELRRALERVAACRPGAERGGLVPSAHRPRLLREGLRRGGYRHADFRNRRQGSGSGSLSRPAARLRVRGMEVHGAPSRARRRRAADRLEPGGYRSRRSAPAATCSPNRADSAPFRQIDCRLDLLPSAKPLKHRAPVHFHSGTAEIEAEVRLLRAASPRSSRAPRAGSASSCAIPRSCCRATASSSACSRR